jgi:hypothetical protein
MLITLAPGHQNEPKNIKIILTRHLLDILVWKDISETTICSIKTLRYFLLVLEVLVCLVGCFQKRKYHRHLNTRLA